MILIDLGGIYNVIQTINETILKNRKEGKEEEFGEISGFSYIDKTQLGKKTPVLTLYTEDCTPEKIITSDGTHRYKSTYEAYLPIRWHSHPTQELLHISGEDIGNVLKSKKYHFEYPTTCSTELIFTTEGIWELFCPKVFNPPKPDEPEWIKGVQELTEQINHHYGNEYLKLKETKELKKNFPTLIEWYRKELSKNINSLFSSDQKNPPFQLFWTPWTSWDSWEHIKDNKYKLQGHPVKPYYIKTFEYLFQKRKDNIKFNILYFQNLV